MPIPSDVSNEPDYYIDIKGLLDRSHSPDVVPETGHGVGGLLGRPWVGVRFDCCGVYTRVYRNRDGTAYVGRCPRCTRKVLLRIGPGGTTSRFFAAE